MKSIFLLTLAAFNFLPTYTKNAPDEIIVLVDQMPGERPIANTIETFWGDKEYFDTIQITGQTIVGKINETISKLKMIRESISFETCIIRFSRDKPVDTLYSWRWFDYWEKDGRMYKDYSSTLKNLFLKLYHVQW